MVLFSLVIMMTIGRISLEQINDVNMQKLKQAENTGSLIIRDMHAKFLRQLYTNPAVVGATNKPDLSLDERIALRNFLENHTAENSLIDSIYLINMKYDIVFSSTTRHLTLDKFFDSDILEWLKTADDNAEITFSRETKLVLDGLVLEENIKYLTIVYRVGNECAMVVNINQEYFSEMVSVASESDMQQTLVLGQSGKVIADSNPTILHPEGFLEDLHAKISEESRSSGVIKSGSMHISYVVSDYLKYTYLTIYDAKYAPSSSIRMILYTAICAVAFFIMNFALTVFLSQKAYMPVQKLIGGFYKKEPPEIGQKNELELLSKDVHKLKDEYNALQTIENKYIIIQRNKILKELLEGDIDLADNDAEQLISKYDIFLPHQCFNVIVFELDPYEENTVLDSSLMRYAVLNIGCELFGSVVTAYGVDFDDHIGILINHQGIPFDEINHVITNIQANMSKHFNITVTAAVQKDSVTSTKIYEAYEYAKYAMLYKLVSAANSIIYYNEVIERIDENTRYPADIEKKILEEIKIKNISAIESNIDKFFKAIAACEYNRIFVYSSRLIIELGREFQKTNHADYRAVELNALELFKSIEKLDELKHIIIRYSLENIENIGVVSVDKKEVIAKSAISYIQENYRDPALNLDAVASALGYSAGYLRITFKTVCGISVANFINDKRFEEVCMLLETTNRSVKDVCEAVGLTYGGYFHSSFKKRTGYTPDKYRTMKKEGC